MESLSGLISAELRPELCRYLGVEGGMVWNEARLAVVHQCRKVPAIVPGGSQILDITVWEGSSEPLVQSPLPVLPSTRGSRGQLVVADDGPEQGQGLVEVLLHNILGFWQEERRTHE